MCAQASAVSKGGWTYTGASACRTALQSRLHSGPRCRPQRARLCSRHHSSAAPILCMAPVVGQHCKRRAGNLERPHPRHQHCHNRWLGLLRQSEAASLAAVRLCLPPQRPYRPKQPGDGRGTQRCASGCWQRHAPNGSARHESSTRRRSARPTWRGEPASSRSAASTWTTRWQSMRTATRSIAIVLS